MTNPLFQDDHEPVEFSYLIRPSVPEYIIGPNNTNGLSDFYWVDMKNNRRQWERKQLGEALSDLSAVEEQLNRYLESCDELTLVVEGVGLPEPDGVQLYELKSYRKEWKPGFFVKRKGLAELYEGWKWGLRAAGVTVIETVSLEMTARAVAGAYRASNKEEHTTLKRYVTHHIPPFDPDIHVDNLARLKNCGLGPERAKLLVKEFGSFYAALTAPRYKLHSVLGVAVTKHLLETIGRKE